MKLWFTCLLLLIVMPAVNALVINEVMYHSHAEFGDDFNEWIEIYNDGESEVDLTGWTICGNELLAGYIVENGSTQNNEGMVLGKGNYALVTDGLNLTNFSEPGTEVYNGYAVLLDGGDINYDISEVLALHVDNGVICGDEYELEGLSDTEYINLNNVSGDLIDYVDYDVVTGADFTLERLYPNPNLSNWLILEIVDACFMTNTDANWQDSAELFGTPGFKNSASPEDYQVEIIQFQAGQNTSPNTETTINITVKNSGYVGTNINLTLWANDFSISNNYTYYASGESKNFTISWTPERGAYILTTHVETENYSLNKSQSVLVKYNIIINEIMYNPAGSDRKREWIELYKADDGCESIEGWRLVESGKQHRLRLFQGNSTLCNGDFAIIADDPETFLAETNTSETLFDSSFSLKNSGELIQIVDQNGFIIDLVEYATTFANGDGNSTELVIVGPNSGWNPSMIEKGTPGAENSAVFPNHEPAISLFTFSPADPRPGIQGNITVSVYNHGQNAENVTLFVTSLTTNTSVNFIILPDEKYEFKLPADLVEGNNSIVAGISVSDDTDFSNNNKTIFVESASRLKISEVMYNPPAEIGSDTDFEWIEIWNSASYDENLDDYSIFVDGKEKQLEGTLLAGQYLIIAKDVAEFENYYGAGIQILKAKSWSLNNDEDNIVLVLYSGNNTYNQSFSYNSNMGGSGNGYSIELNETDIGESTRYAGSPGQKNNPDDEIKSNPFAISSSSLKKIDSAGVAVAKQSTIETEIISAPDVVGIGTTFLIKAKITNNQNRARVFDVYSYIYEGNQLASEGGWTGNKQKIKVGKKDSVIAILKNKIKEGTEYGSYKLRVRAKSGESNYDANKVIGVSEDAPSFSGPAVISQLYLSKGELKIGQNISISTRVDSLSENSTSLKLVVSGNEKYILLKPLNARTEIFNFVLSGSEDITAELYRAGELIDEQTLKLSVEDSTVTTETNFITGLSVFSNSRDPMTSALVLLSIILSIMVVALMFSKREND